IGPRLTVFSCNILPGRRTVRPPPRVRSPRAWNWCARVGLKSASRNRSPPFTCGTAATRRNRTRCDMSESGNVDPFTAQEESEISTETPNPAERLHLAEAKRMAEAIVFASAEPVSEKMLASRLPEGVDLRTVMQALVQDYEKRGVNLVRVNDSWAF